MAAKKNQKRNSSIESELNETTDHVQDVSTGFTRADKEILINNYLQTKERIVEAQKQVDTIKELLSDCCFELQKAFGGKKIRIGDTIFQVRSRKHEIGDSKTYFLHSVDLTVDETF